MSKRRLVRFRDFLVLPTGSPLQRIASLVLRFLPSYIVKPLLIAFRNDPFSSGLLVRSACVRRLSQECGTNVIIAPGVYIFGFERLRIGNNVSIQHSSHLSSAGGISIGNDVSIAHGCTIMSNDHDFRANPTLPIRDSGMVYGEVIISNDVWLGCYVTILRGVTIGERTVVGAGAVVTRPIPSHSLCAGVPAKVLKTLAERASFPHETV